MTAANFTSLSQLAELVAQARAHRIRREVGRCARIAVATAVKNRQEDMPQGNLPEAKQASNSRNSELQL
jgi:hypothetical protein